MPSCIVPVNTRLEEREVFLRSLTVFSYPVRQWQRWVTRAEVHAVGSNHEKISGPAWVSSDSIKDHSPTSGSDETRINSVAILRSADRLSELTINTIVNELI